MKAIGWSLVGVGLFVWACGARGFADESRRFCEATTKQSITAAIAAAGGIESNALGENSPPFRLCVASVA